MKFKSFGQSPAIPAAAPDVRAAQFGPTAPAISVTQTQGKVVAIGPQRVEVDNPVYPGNSGSPIIALKTGKVIGVLTEAELITLNAFEKASFQNNNSAIKSEIRYFGCRIDTALNWLPLNWSEFQLLDSQISQSRKELNWIIDYFTGSKDSYNEFKELHEARNRTIVALSQSKLNPTSKVDELNRFMRDIDSLIRRTQTRIVRKNPIFIQKEQIQAIDLLASKLHESVISAQRDPDLAISLMRRHR